MNAMLETYLYGAGGVAIIIAWIALIYFGIARPGKYGRSWIAARRAYGRGPQGRTRLDLPRGNVEEQLRAVMAGSFERRRLLNAGEYRVFKIIEDCVTAPRRGYRVFAQTSLGEVLASPNETAFRSINSKRVDILIVDQGGWPVLAVEFQGGGHYQGSAAIRDAVKKEALDKAGVGYVEVFSSDTAAEIRLLVCERLGWKPRLASPEQAERV